jgi:hypothetical protein
MPSFNSGPGTGGLVGILVGIVLVSALMTCVLDIWSHWLPIGVAIIVGLMAVKSIGR